MSLPKFPIIDPPLTTENSLNMILISIAMEEMGLSHIINAEGEKLQYILGTLEGGRTERASVEELLAVNRSIKCLLDSVMQNQIILKSKLDSAVCALECCGPCPAGPAGPAGPQGEPGPAGPPGCAHEHCAIAFPGHCQCWTAGEPMTWLRSDCSKCGCMRLSPDGRKISLGRGKCYALSFAIDLCAEDPRCGSVAIGVQTRSFQKKEDVFTAHFPVMCADAPVTASASGIYISTRNYSGSTELSVSLLSHDSVRVNKASMYITEL